MNIIVKKKSVYGKEIIYPVCEKAKLLCELAGTKTITPDMLKTIQKLGYIPVLQTETLDEYLKEHVQVIHVC